MIKTTLFKSGFILLLVVWLLNFVATKLYLFWTVWWMDMLVHFLAGACVSIAVLVLYSLYKPHKPYDFIEMFWYAICGTIFVGILWETYELVFNITSFADGIEYVTDTLSDIVMDASGGIAGFIYSFLLLKNRYE